MKARKIVYRKLTHAEYFNINKPPGAEEGGGGQSYLDFPTKLVPPKWWGGFFAGCQQIEKTQGPSWTEDVQSLGLTQSQRFTIYQRRAASFSISSQKLNSTRANRVRAWDPAFSGFPEAPEDLSGADDSRIPPLVHGVVIFLVLTDDQTFRAGWFRESDRDNTWYVPDALEQLFHTPAGCLDLDGAVELLDQIGWPFGEIEDKVEEEFNALEKFFDADTAEEPVLSKEVLVKVRIRNRKAVRALKKLYGQCQIGGTDGVFQKRDGTPYLEVHHLVPLGEGGSDDPKNMIVVGAEIHMALHYAKVSEIDLNKMESDKLQIKINDEVREITWLPGHAALVQESISD